jgi:hypothetical protein
MYANVAYPSVMKSIDTKIEHFMKTIVLEEEEKVQFCKIHDVEGVPSNYGKVYYAERRDGCIHLMTIIKKGQKAGSNL